MGGLTGQRLHGERSDEFCGPPGQHHPNRGTLLF